MMSSPAGQSPVVIDASFALAVVLPVPTSKKAQERLVDWHRAGRPILAPSHWIIEAVSGLRKLWFVGELSAEEARGASSDLFVLGVDSVAPAPELCQASLRWAERLTQSKAYDSFYLSLADAEQADFWTADARLYRRARQLGVERVHLIEP